MRFNTHYDLNNKHAFLSPSNHHWLNYDAEKLRDVYFKSSAAKRGTQIHELAKRCIMLNVNLPRNKSSLNQFVNDAIGYRMSPEQILFYSLNAFGTADAISFRNNILRIHDLKTGTSRVMMEQLEVYAALFCLEYNQQPNNFDIELRIYQTSSVVVHTPDHTTIRRIMEKIVLFDSMIEKFKLEEDDPWLG